MTLKEQIEALEREWFESSQWENTPHSNTLTIIRELQARLGVCSEALSTCEAGKGFWINQMQFDYDKIYSALTACDLTKEFKG